MRKVISLAEIIGFMFLFAILGLAGTGCGGNPNVQPPPCVPECNDKTCGDNGCGGTCGSCQTGDVCDLFSQCVPECKPDCSSKTCGNDGCGGTCGSCDTDSTCNEQSGQCEPKIDPCAKVRSLEGKTFDCVSRVYGHQTCTVKIFSSCNVGCYPVDTLPMEEVTITSTGMQFGQTDTCTLL